ncbi:hypothetical protein Gotur_023727, partial [Gossypium turneri]
MVFKIEPRPRWARPYLNRICSTGSYLCVLKFKGDRIQSLVDEPRLCDLSVITSLVISLLDSLRPQRIVPSLPCAAGKVTQLICSIGSYLCVLKFKGDRIPSLVDEPLLCDLSVITGLVFPLLVSLRPQRIILSLPCAAGKVTQLSLVILGNALPHKSNQDPNHK